MIEVGKEYDLKHLIIVDGDTETQTHEDDGKYKVLAIDGDFVWCINTVSKEEFVFSKSAFIDPEHPEDDKNYMYVVKESVKEALNSLEKVMLPMNLSFWKDLTEDMGGCAMASATAVAGGGGVGAGALGAAPCPALGQVIGGSISGCMVNGVPVAGQSVKKTKKKKKKSKKNETVGVKLNGTNHIKLDFDEYGGKVYIDIDNELTYAVDIDTFMNKVSDYIYDLILEDKFEFDVNWFDHFGKLNHYLEKIHESCISDHCIKPLDKYNIPDLKFDKAINLLRFGKTNKDKAVYSDLLEMFDKAGKMYEYEQYAINEYGINDITLDNIGKLSESVEKIIAKLLDEDFKEEYEDIAEQISKYLDRLNFQYANTEDIVYKKEGDNKYLFKFDNENGIIKVKVLKNEEVLIDKEYDINAVEDIQPIFDEIEQIYKKYGL